MQEVKEPAPTSMALASLVLIWSETIARRQTLWLAIKESMETLEIRHHAVKERKARMLPKVKVVKPRKNQVFVIHEDDYPKPPPRPAGHKGPWFE